MGFSSQGPFWPSARRSVLLLAEVSGVPGSDLASLQPGPGECSECQIPDMMYLPCCVTRSMLSPLHVFIWKMCCLLESAWKLWNKLSNHLFCNKSKKKNEAVRALEVSSDFAL